MQAYDSTALEGEPYFDAPLFLAVELSPEFLDEVNALALQLTKLSSSTPRIALVKPQRIVAEIHVPATFVTMRESDVSGVLSDRVENQSWLVPSMQTINAVGEDLRTYFTGIAVTMTSKGPVVTFVGKHSHVDMETSEIRLKTLLDVLHPARPFGALTWHSTR